jgi:hypothetical protein
MQLLGAAVPACFVRLRETTDNSNNMSKDSLSPPRLYLLALHYDQAQLASADEKTTLKRSS